MEHALRLSSRYAYLSRIQEPEGTTRCRTDDIMAKIRNLPQYISAVHPLRSAAEEDAVDAKLQETHSQPEWAR
jgi:hypothetical protein